MKTEILKSLDDLINAEDPEQRINLQIKASHLITAAKFDIDTEKELHTKNLIISTIRSYAQTSDTSLKSALIEHLKTLDVLLKE